MSRERGSALIVVMVVLVLVLGLGVAVLNINLSSLTRNKFTEKQLESFYLAEAGIEEVRSKLRLSNKGEQDKFESSYSKLPHNPAQGFTKIAVSNLASGNYILKAKKINGGKYKVRSIGNYKGQESIIEVTISELKNYFQEQVDRNRYNLVGRIQKFPWANSKNHNNPKHNFNDFNAMGTLKRNDLHNLFDFDFYKNHAQHTRSAPPGVDSDDEYCQGRAWLNHGEDSLELGETRFQNYFDSNNSGSGAVNPWHPENMNHLEGVNYVETDNSWHWELEAEDIKATADKPAIIVIGRNKDGRSGRNPKISIDIEASTERKLDNIYFVVDGDVQINCSDSAVRTGKDTFVYATGNIKGDLGQNNWNGVLAAKGNIDLDVPGNEKKHPSFIKGTPYYNPKEKRVDWDALTVNGRAWGRGAKFYRRITFWEQIK